MRVEDDVRGRYARYIHVYVLLDVNKFSKPGDQSGRWMPRHQGCQAAKPTKPDPMAWQGWYKNSNRTLYHWMVNTFTIALDGENHQLSDLLPS